MELKIKEKIGIRCITKDDGQKIYEIIQPELLKLEAMFKRKILNILTDDGDFATVSGIQVFTANRNVLVAASSQGKLCVR